MTGLEYFKKGTAAIVGISVSHVVGQVIRHNVAPEKLHHKVEVYIGQLVLAMIVSEVAEDWIEEKVDALSDWYEREIKPQLES